jgi:molecular chaperone HtpG
MKKGTINVQTEDIFPIIKKFLYSDHEIFLRELISNAVDATQKLKALAAMGKVKDELGDLTVQVVLDKDAKTIKIIDRGIGMTADEVEKYIAQIAFSGAEEFVKKYKNKSQEERANLIGHFGLGFYSSFMVSDKVEIFSKTYKKGGKTKAVHWECDGSPDYTLEDAEKSERGTEIVLHINDESKEYLESYKIEELLKKYCSFLPVPIQFGTKTESKDSGKKDKDGNPEYESIEVPNIINNPTPLWTKKPSSLKDEDYKAFYRELYPMVFDEPLFHIHLNVDYPFNLTGILYFPKIKQNVEVRKDKIQLYSNQVFITDNVEGVVPDFLTLLHGVLDSPDIPLNVSRSYLQSDSNVKKISNHISRKVADKLAQLFKKDRAEFEKKWDDIRVFIEYGIISEETFYKKAQGFTLFKNTEGKYFTFEEYKKLIKENQTDKNKKLVYLYTTDPEKQFSYVEAAKNKGYDVLLMDGIIDNHFVNHLEQKFEDAKFTRVDADIINKLIEKEDSPESKLDEKAKEELKKIFDKSLTPEFTLVFEAMNEKDMPAIITETEFMRRMKDMSLLGGGMNMMGGMPDSYNFVVNENHPLIQKLQKEKDEKVKENLAKQIVFSAKLMKDMLKGEELTQFVNSYIEKLS